MKMSYKILLVIVLALLILFSSGAAVMVLLSQTDIPYFGRTNDLQAHLELIGITGFFTAVITVMVIYFILIGPIEKIITQIEKLNAATDQNLPFKEIKIKELSVLVVAINRLLKKLHEEKTGLIRMSSRLYQTQQIANIGSWEFEIKSNTIWFSEQAQKINGVDSMDMAVNMDAVWKYVLPDDLDFTKNEINRIIENATEDSIIYRIINQKTGKIIPVLAHLKVETDEKNEPVRVFGSIQDITQVKEMEEKLHESERMKASLLSNLPGIAYRCLNDENFTMEYLSEGCYSLTGYTPENLIENKDLSYADIIPDEYMKIIRDSIRTAVNTGKYYQFEYRIKTADGRMKWVWEQGKAVYDDMRVPVALEGLIIDITDRKIKEEEILYLSRHDVLTGVYNRSYFEEIRKKLEIRSKLPLSVIIGDMNGLKLVNDSFGHAAGDKMLARVAFAIRTSCKPESIIARTGGDEFSIILENTTEDEARDICKAILENCEKIKDSMDAEVLYPGLSLGHATKTRNEEPLTEVIKHAEENMYRSKMLQTKSLHNSIINAIKTTLLERNLETSEHTERLIMLSRELGKRLHLDEDRLNELELLASLHDIGKIGLDDSILKKPGPLTPGEWTEMKKHPGIGYRIASASPELNSIADLILSHHEHWDGTGYPRGLSKLDIPLAARIMAIVDAYDAMTHDRVYRASLAKEEAIQEILEHSGTQFDPNLVSEFIRMKNEM